MTTSNGRRPPDDPLDHPAMSDSVRALARRGTIKRYAKGTIIIHEGAVDDTLYVIASGRVRVYSGSDDSDREVTYGTYGPGEYVGEFGLDGGQRAASVITLEATQCAVITRHTLEQHIAECPSFAFELLAKVIRRARAATLSTRQLALNDVYGRLKFLLDTLAVPQANCTRRVEERLTHKEIANRIGCTREMVSRVLKDLEVGEWLRMDADLADKAPRIVLLKGLPARW